MDIYASDDEKGEEIKQWWRDNGRAVVVGIVLSTALIFSGRYWFTYQATLTEQASQSYQQLATLLTEDKKAEADEKIQQFFSEFSSTPYAVFGAFDMAKKAVELNDNAAAKIYFQWIIDHAELTGHKALAQLRLSQLLLAESKFELAYNLVEQPVSDSFKSLFSEVQADILVAQGKNSEARTAYQTAMMALGQGEPRQGILQLKLDNVAIPR
ncbi:MAG: putative negative regulator of RcsB-dependent stress response [Methylophagaceae bacterium]|jgi:predicted negative regulator of RcsB-dependent stress response